MMKFFIVLGLMAVASAEIYTADLKDVVSAELAMVRAVYGDRLDEISIGSFTTEDFTMNNIRVKGLNNVKLVGPSQMYVNTQYLTAFTQGVIGVDNAEILVEEFKAPYLFYEGNQTLYNVSFTIDKVALNIHEGIHFSLPGSCAVSYGLEFMAMDGTILHSSDTRFNNKDVTPFMHYTVRLAINDFLAKNVQELPEIKNCVPFAHSSNKLQSYLSNLNQ